MEESKFKKKEIVNTLLSKEILIGKEFLNQNPQEINFEILPEKLLFMFEGVPELLSHDYEDLEWGEVEKVKALSEKKGALELYNRFLESLLEKKQEKLKESPVKVLFSYDTESKKREVNDFVSYFNNRYKSLERMLRARPELQNLTSIKRIIGKKEKEEVSFICMVKEVSFTKNNNLIVEVEDPTGHTKLIISKNKPELFDESKDIVPDEVIGVIGVNGEGVIFVNNIIWPDVPIKELRKSEDDVYAVFLSDIHIGSDHFLPKEFENFIKWTNLEHGGEAHKEIAKKVKYIFIVGDIVDGAGIYPGQENELIIADIYEQYIECAKLLSKIPKHITIIICPGNHDAMRIAEPQPVFYKDFAGPLWELDNAVLVSNPSLVNIHSSERFPGLDVLLYHGYSFDHFIANVDSIRNQGGYDRADLVMKFLLKRRHLAPSHTSTLYIPDTNSDSLVIEKVPDIFVTGHIHKSYASTYKNVTLICGSCWQSKTPFQEKVGHNPEPCRVPIVNLKTRGVKILKF